MSRSGIGPTILQVRVRRYRCEHCGCTWRQDTTAAAAPRAKISRGGLGWALTAIVVDHLTVARVAAGLGVSWHTANSALIAEGKRRLMDDPVRFEGVTTIGVDEHVWRHTRLGDKYVTVIIDLTPVREKTGPARLLDMVEGRSKAVFKQWLNGRPKQWRDGIEVVAMDGLSRRAWTSDSPGPPAAHNGARRTPEFSGHLFASAETAPRAAVAEVMASRGVRRSHSGGRVDASG